MAELPKAALLGMLLAASLGEPQEVARRMASSAVLPAEELHLAELAGCPAGRGGPKIKRPHMYKTP